LFLVGLAVSLGALLLMAGSASANYGPMTLLSPAPKTTVASGQSVTFSWNAAPYTDLYWGPYQIEFDVASDPGFSKIVYSGNASCTGSMNCPSTQTEGSFAPGVYYWRVTSSYQACLSSDRSGGEGMSSQQQFLTGLCSPQSSPTQSFTVTQPASPVTSTVSRPAPTPPPAAPATSSGSNPAATAPVPPTDTTAPRVRALAATVRAVGQRTLLRFTASDDSGKASIAAAIFRGNKQPLVKRTWLQAVQAGATYRFSWTPPTAGTYKFCVFAKDLAGNASNPSCATVSVS
jgi:hypothetical protein